MTDAQTETPPGPKKGSGIRTLVDFGALLAWALTYAFLRVVQKMDGDEALVQATWVLMGASFVALVIGWFAEKRLAWMPAITGGFALVFGALTLFYHDPSIIKIKVTVMNAFFAAVLLGSLMFGRLPVKAILGEAIEMDDSAWRQLTLRYGLYFLASAAVNEVIWRTQTDDFWVAFKGVLFFASLVFTVANVPFLMKHAREPGGKSISPEPPDTGL